MTEFGVVVGKSSIDRAIRAFNYTVKRVSVLPERRNELENIRLRYEYAREFFHCFKQMTGGMCIFLMKYDLMCRCGVKGAVH